MASDNQALKDKAHAMELEGEESGALAQEIVTFINGKQTEFDEAMATAQAKIDELSATQLPDADRDEITGALDNAAAASNSMQEVLRALITPPAEPVPDTPPVATRRRR